MRQLSVIWQKLTSWLTERWLRIHTTDRVEALTSEGCHYTPLPYVMIFQMFKDLKPGHRDVFVDIGCGKGRVLCCASRLNIKEAVGIELNPLLVEVAQRNVIRLRGARAPVNVVTVSAECYSYDGATILYLYNPFNERITRLVLAKLEDSYKRNPRLIRVVYANPLYEHAFLDSGLWEKYSEWSATEFPGFGCAVSFWRTQAESEGKL